MKGSKKVKIASMKKKVMIPSVKKKRRSRAKASLRGWGEVAGTYMGGSTGGMIGRAAGDLVSRITGFGDYKVSKNSIAKGNSVPTFRNDQDGMVVCHREFLLNVTGSIPFRNNFVPINPGLAGSFPLLSQLSRIFEEYEMVGLVFEYRPSSGTAVSSTNPALGVVILATDYDAANPLFSSKQQMESYEYATSSVPYMGCLHPVECARTRNVLDNLYVRIGTVPPATDVRLYDMGNFQYATEGMQMNDQVIGELWVSYDVRLRKPRLPPSIVIEQRPSYLRVRNMTLNNGDNGSIFGAGASSSNVSSDSDLQTFGVTFPFASVTTRLKVRGFYTFFFTCSAGLMDLQTNPVTFNGTLGVNVIYGPTIFQGNSSAVLNYNSPASSTLPMFFATQQCFRVLESADTSANDVLLTYNGVRAYTEGNSNLLVFYLGETLPLTLVREPTIEKQLESMDLGGALVVKCDTGKLQGSFGKLIATEPLEEKDCVVISRS